MISGHAASWMTGIATRYNRAFPEKIKFKRSIFKFEDGGEIAIDSSVCPDSAKPLIIMVHGYLSTIYDHYA